MGKKHFSYRQENPLGAEYQNIKQKRHRAKAPVAR